MQLDEPKAIDPAPAGTHLAILVKLIDLGWQESSFAGQTKEQRQAILTWELPNKLNKAGRPYLVSKTMNLSLHEKATFRSWAESIMGRTFSKADLFGAGRFNVKDLIDRTCLLKVDHVEREGKINARVTNLMSPPEGIPAPARLTDTVYFTLDPEGFDPAVFETLSTWAKEKIEKSETYIGLKARMTAPAADDPRTAMRPAKQPTAAEIIDDEIPF